MTYFYRWDRHGRKGQRCKVTARSGVALCGLGPPLVVFGEPGIKRFNSIRVTFADGFTMVTSGNAIRRAS
ncbi:hypothetical protein [Mesorhizobium neociceri]|uniref:Uncharacterized protein n=1 Tax=Mesorhizobium neociceri TaxID=1307853 RepID=A0A838B715_9HYPH|nr:hypothetical protein [Mesorhizobium neociceri]MBA1141709.1 hypothetical protein [Mesorhizobium neociceri]